jgi:16S rRNA (guanine966-N2)-methyltransferase
MRIIGGTLKGRTIPVSRTFTGRPTTDFAREGLFNMLSHLLPIEGAMVLDLFAGTGAFSLECLSRGATSSLAVDINYSHVKGIQQAFDTFRLTASRAIRADVWAFIRKDPGQFDLILADPPYDLPMLAELPDALLKTGILKDHGWLIIEHPDTISFSEYPGFDRHRSFGAVNFSFFRPLTP